VSKKKLLFIVNVDWFFISHRLPIALEAMTQGYEVHLLCAITDKEQYLKSLGLIVHPFAFSRSGKNILTELAKEQYLKSLGLIVHPFAFSRSGKNILTELAIIFKLYWQIKKIKPDLLHLVTIKPVLYGGIAARIAKVPGVISAISGLGFLFVKRAGLHRRLHRRLLRVVVLFLYRFAMGHPNQRVIFQNPTDMDALVKAGGIDKDKTRLIRGSCVDLQDYPFIPEPDGTPVIVMASRLLKDKGVHEFIEAARILKSKSVKVHFQLIGEPDFENPESVTAESMQIWREEGIVECLGFRSDISKLFSQAHIITLPSYYGEGLPKVLIEAAACGRVVITTDIPGCRNAIESDISGLLIPARDVEALAQAMEYLLENTSLRQKMGKAGRVLAESEFGIEKTVNY